MDPTMARILDDLKELLLAKAITFAEYQEGVAAAHSRASSLEKEVPVKMEALDTEMQEAPVKMEAPVKSVKSVKVKATVTSVKCVKSVMKAPVKIEAPVKMEVSLSTKYRRRRMSRVARVASVRCRHRRRARKCPLSRRILFRIGVVSVRIRWVRVKALRRIWIGTL